MNSRNKGKPPKTNNIQDERNSDDLDNSSSSGSDGIGDEAPALIEDEKSYFA